MTSGPKNAEHVIRDQKISPIVLLIVHAFMTDPNVGAGGTSRLFSYYIEKTAYSLSNVV